MNPKPCRNSSKIIKGAAAGNLGADGLFTRLFTPQSPSGGYTYQPKAYMYILLFDEQFKFDVANSYVVQVSAWVQESRQTLYGSASVKKNAYAYIHFRNESNDVVFFDNFNLTNQAGPLLEETHYNPFGLTMAGISSKAAGKLENKFKYNAAELNTTFDLNQYEFFYRTYDPQIGRWHGLDTKPTDMVSLYAAMVNNPVRYADPLGDTIALFRPNGTFWKFQENGKKEWSGMVFQKDNVTSSYEKDGVKYEVHSYSEGKAFEFNDAAVDVTAIKYGTINRVEMMSDATVDRQIDRSGVRGADAQESPISYAKNQGANRMDYGVRGAQAGDLKPNTFYIRENRAYNIGDIGNYLWGTGMAELGIGLGTASLGAHYNNMFNGRSQKTPLYDFGPGTYGKPGLFDSQADQRAIRNGYSNSPKGAMLIKQELQNWPKYNPK